MPITIPEARELMAAGVHFGHSSGRWHPKFAPYIYGTRDKLHILDLDKTREQLEAVLPELSARAKDGKNIVLVGTKKQVSERIRGMAERLGMPYVSERWLGGTLTNWAEMQASIAKMKRLRASLEEGSGAKMIKKERVMAENDLRRMTVKFGGVQDMTRKPDVMFVVDPSYEHNAVREARLQGVEIFGLADTNSDPSLLDYVIPANDDGPKSLEMMLGFVEQALSDGLAERPAPEKEDEPRAEPAPETEAA